MYKQKGITLIALVITIIVMLILVAVTVTAVVNSGLFGKAGEAAERWAKEQEKEIGLGIDNSLDEYISGNRETAKNYDKYSEKEQIIGCWYDGKPIYRKIINCWFNGITAVGYRYFYSDETSIKDLNIEKIISSKWWYSNLPSSLCTPTIARNDVAENRIAISQYSTDGLLQKLMQY